MDNDYFKKNQKVPIVSSKNMIVLLIVLPDVIPFGLAPGSLWASHRPGGENPQLPQIIINGYP